MGMRKTPRRTRARAVATWRPPVSAYTLAAAQASANLQTKSLGKSGNALRSFSHVVMGVGALGVGVSLLYSIYLESAEITAKQKKNSRKDAGRIGMISGGILFGGVVLYGLSHFSFGVSSGSGAGIGTPRSASGGPPPPSKGEVKSASKDGTNITSTGYFTVDELVAMTTIPGGPILQNGQVIPNRFTFILSIDSIFRANPDGTTSAQALSESDLIQQGEIANAAGQELTIVIRGDARAKWSNDLLHTLISRGIPYRTRNDF